MERKSPSALGSRPVPVRNWNASFGFPLVKRQEVVRLQGVVRTALNEAGVNGNGHVAAAALAKLVQEFLEH